MLTLSKFFAAIMVATSVACMSDAGTFTLTGEDYASINVTYSGDVIESDLSWWRYITEAAEGRVIYLTIDSGGGGAYAGLDLYWEMEKYPYLVTVAGGQGAYSAAAIMWLAGDERRIPTGSVVAFHSAYCNWDPNGNPNIGCDTTDFQFHLTRVLNDAGFAGDSFNAMLNQVQSVLGTDGWLVITGKGWLLWDSTYGDTWYFDAEYLIREAS
jgi:hypothetical protein